ncbi:histidine kinase dimerization/phospho-acceptor domain-containing protein [Cryptosporangium sp. NPDC051539]|uniref:HAMP domain-containing sensor histidine kinase n=1 Tax=Cryptosporangium sp. NPDC051539 TaxID=3363962 RepID=UPI003788DC1E
MRVATRLTILTSAVATVAVLVAAVLSAGLIRGATGAESRRLLAREADAAANSTTPRPWLARALRAQQVSVVQVDADQQLTTDDPDAAAAAKTILPTLATGTSVSTSQQVDGLTWLLEGRPVGSGAVVLAQPADASRTFGRQILVRTSLSLAVGLAVAILAGLLLARRSSRTLRRTAVAAHRMAAGDRDVRLPVEGPTEIAEVAGALNSLAGALDASESRQRDFLLGISHELRTPLTAINGFAESLADGVVTGDDTAAVGATIHAEAQRLDRLVGDLLDLARLDAVDFPLDLTDVDLTALVAEAARVWGPRCAAEGVDFRLDVVDEPLVLETDPIRVRQIVDGLAENALRVTPAGRPIVFALRTDEAHAVLDVRDGGPGLTEEDYPVAFDRMVLHTRYRGVRRVGTGLGLALVHRLATRLGGTPSAGPAPEGGARFSVRFPA